MRNLKPIPALILIAWVIMAAFLVKREYFTAEPVWLPGSARPDTGVVEWWSGIYMEGQKVGYAYARRSSQGDTLYRVRGTQLLRLTTLGVTQVINLRNEATLNPDFSLRSFSFALSTDDASSSLTAPGRRGGMTSSFEMRGGVDGRRLRVMVIRGGETVGREQVIPVEGPIYLNAGPDMLLAQGGFEIGESIRVPTFDPATMRTESSEIRVAGLDTIDVRGQRYPAFRLETEYFGFTIRVWVNERGEELRGEVPLGVTTLETVRESYEQALNEGWDEKITLDLVNLAAIPAGVMKIEGARQTDSMSVHISGIDLTKFDLTFGRQELIEEIIEVSKEDLSEFQDYQLPSTEWAHRRYLQSTPHVESEHPMIVVRMNRIRRLERNARPFAEKLVHWVYEYLDKVPTAGIPSALEVLNRGGGDCNEHTVLFTALARAAGLPTVMNAGVVYLDGKFYYHAWPSVWLGDWVAVDPTFDQFPADATHISFIRGGLDRQVDLIRIMGRISIDVVSYFPLPEGSIP